MDPTKNNILNVIKYFQSIIYSMIYNFVSSLRIVKFHRYRIINRYLVCPTSYRNSSVRIVGTWIFDETFIISDPIKNVSHKKLSLIERKRIERKMFESNILLILKLKPRRIPFSNYIYCIPPRTKS